MAIAPIFSPAIAGTSQRSRWSSVPKCASAGVAMSRLHRDRHRDRGRAAAGELFHEHDPGREVAVAAAEAFGIVEAEEPELAATAEQRVGEPAGPFPFVHVGADFGVDESAHRGPELFVLGGEDGVARGHSVLRCHTRPLRVDCRIRCLALCSNAASLT